MSWGTYHLRSSLFILLDTFVYSLIHDSGDFCTLLQNASAKGEKRDKDRQERCAEQMCSDERLSASSYEEVYAQKRESGTTVPSTRGMEGVIDADDDCYGGKTSAIRLRQCEHIRTDPSRIVSTHICACMWRGEGLARLDRTMHVDHLTDEQIMMGFEETMRLSALKAKTATPLTTPYWLLSWIEHVRDTAC